MATGRLQVVDYSYSRINLAQARSYGVVGCMRYLYDNGKGLTPAEIEQFRAAGMALGLNFEAGAGDFVGFAAGVDHAQRARRIADRLGFGRVVIIFSADFDVPASRYRDVGDAIAGAMTVLGQYFVGCYGHARLTNYLRGRFGDAIYLWQTYAWSGGARSPWFDLYQFRNSQDFCGGQVDFNEIGRRTFWAIGSNGHDTSDNSHTPIPNTPNVPSEEDDLSAAADAIMKKLTDMEAAISNIWNRLDAVTPGAKTGRPTFWFKDPQGRFAWAWGPGAGRATTRLLDVGDGNTLVNLIAQVAAKVAAGDAQLLTAIETARADVLAGTVQADGQPPADS